MRVPELDLIELIWHLIAYASHLQEIIMWNENVNKNILDLYKNAIEDRRAYMRLLKAKTDKPELWCAVKHAIATWQYATEVYQATDMNDDSEEFDLLVNSTSNLASVLSMYLWVEYTECLRCLNDKLKDLNS